ncbi:cytochrome C oxidase subunit IV family protein [Kiloniella sp.]|uniref:cytochrome C oxidase subunit IV family protein n=1 Tax=Kiloniella sp. TaxID=1938587 RepID=UPI003B018567
MLHTPRKTNPVFRLLLTWVLMSGLTIISMLSGDVLETKGHTKSIGLVSVSILMMITLFKCRLLLLDFLELRHSTKGWRRGFIFVILLITTMIAAAYALARGFDLF